MFPYAVRSEVLKRVERKSPWWHKLRPVVHVQAIEIPDQLYVIHAGWLVVVDKEVHGSHEFEFILG